MTLIDLGLIDGNFWNANHVDRLEAAINSSSPAGEVVMTIATAAPTGWLLLNGQVVPNAQSLYPDLWAVAPVAWRSGASLNLPNATTRFPIGQDATHAIGTTGGANTKAIAEANLPVHHHAFNGLTANQNHHHTHSPGDYLAGDQWLVQRFPGPHAVFDTGDTSTGATIQSYPGSSIEIDDGTGNGGNHGHTFSGNTTDVGSAAALDVTPAWLALNFIIRAY